MCSPLAPINILVTIDANYLKPLQVMLKSLFLSSPSEIFQIFLMHSCLSPSEVNEIDTFVRYNGHSLFEIKIDERCFCDAPLTKHYPKEMYYRLLAFRFLPAQLDRILYLDPDILVINPIKELYYTDLSGWMFAAAFHDILLAKEINRPRFRKYDIKEYFNSGVLLMNLDILREQVDEQEIYNFIEENKNNLILPDQDILNSLYSKRIKKLDEFLFNYDVRYFKSRQIVAKKRLSMDYIINNIVILHFCGRRKPWHNNYSGAFHSLYKHYEKLTFNNQFHI